MGDYIMRFIICFLPRQILMAVLFGFCLSGSFAFSAMAVEPQASFDQWLEVLKKDLQKEGVSEAVILEAWPKMKYVSRVIEHDRNQSEFKMTFNDYIKRVYDRRQIDRARTLYQENKVLLSEIGKKYGVQPKYIVALWGIESRFGSLMGDFFVPAALATLAYEGRRKEFFHKETMNAFQILSKNQTTVDNFQGSWAGAMGQIQFMPSSYLSFAVDYDQDGKIDIWHSKPDIFASAANYLKQAGWKTGQKWGREVSLKGAPAIGSDVIGKGDCDITRSLEAWQKIGVRGVQGQNLPADEITACLVLPDKDTGRAFLVYDNFKSILKWNRSYYFALAVGTLADFID